MLRRLFGPRKLRLPKPTPDEAHRIEELRRVIRPMPSIDLHGGTPAANEWAANRAELRSLILHSDPRAFLSWNVIRRTMLVDGADYVGTEYTAIHKQNDPRMIAAMEDNAIGRPPASRWQKTSSDNLIHHVYALSRFEAATGVPIDSLSTIVEFGGGYGSLARAIFKLGFKGRYVIFDLPEFSALQQFYLGLLGLPVRKGNAQAAETPSISCVTEMNQIEATLGGSAPSLLIAMWSLSETPLSLREKFLETVGAAENYLFAYQDKFGEVDNLEYFQSIGQNTSRARWKRIPIDHQPGHHHLFGQGGTTNA
jgi:hypothetical protein